MRHCRLQREYSSRAVRTASYAEFLLAQENAKLKLVCEKGDKVQVLRGHPNLNPNPRPTNHTHGSRAESKVHFVSRVGGSCWYWPKVTNMLTVVSADGYLCFEVYFQSSICYCRFISSSCFSRYRTRACAAGTSTADPARWGDRTGDLSRCSRVSAQKMINRWQERSKSMSGSDVLHIRNRILFV